MCPSVLQAASLDKRRLCSTKATPGPLGCRETRPKTSLCIIQQRLTDDHNSTNELQPILLNFLLQYCLAEGPDPREDNRVGDEVIVFVFVPVL